MKRSLKVSVSIFMVIAMLLSLSAFATVASAGPMGGLRVTFHKPAGWSDDIKIHIWNTNTNYDTVWPGNTMQKQDDGTYFYANASYQSCNVVIHDNNGNQTSDLTIPDYAGIYQHNNSVTVKDNKVVESGWANINFKKPDNWGSKIKMYYYSNDSQELDIVSWPGVDMTYIGDWYHANLTGIKNARVIFSDGVNQYPPALEPGIPVVAVAGNNLWVKDGVVHESNPEDEYGDSIETATELVNPFGTFTGRKNYQDDVDFVKFVMPSSFASISTYTKQFQLKVYDSNGALVQYGTRITGLTGGKTYYMELDLGGQNGSYSFTIEDKNAVYISGAQYVKSTQKLVFYATKSYDTTILDANICVTLYNTGGKVVSIKNISHNAPFGGVFKDYYIPYTDVAAGYKAVISVTGGNTGNEQLAQPLTYTFS